MNPLLIAGLVVFLGVHSLRIVADDWRTRQLARLGEARWKGLYSVASAIGLGLIVAGYPDTRADAALWPALPALRHGVSLLMLPALILIVAAYIPGNRLKSTLGHPMLIGVLLWALGHLAVNGRPGDLLLFGSFAFWALAALATCRRRDRAAGITRPPGQTGRDIVVFGAGLAGWAAFAFVLHALLIGVAPLS